MGEEHCTKQASKMQKRKKEKAQKKKTRSEPGLQKKKEVSGLARVKWAGGKRERGGQGSSHTP